MKNIKGKSNYLIISVSCVIILISICFFSINNVLKGTRSGFGNGCISACLGANLPVKYLPNYPDGFYSVDAIETLSCAKYLIDDNKFEVPRGYLFDGWNTESDGSGDNYKAFDCITLGEDGITLYAQWKEKVIDLGDLNLDSNMVKYRY